ncbi:Protein vip1 [Coemansia sp. RSA 1722]|nr:Protein vip1 [Coemansia sp. RSA 486]KAJ2228345.1 Protein vip1 [Coemansia sp. RSA 485]KAJ2605463.1 Protein vip1 [Coemansia sp. RSA 1722]
MAAFAWNTSVPSTPDPTYVVVDSIALSATESNVRDFFAFCGPIELLELKKQENGTQSALIKFGNIEAAKTSLLLTNAVINYEPITVSPLFQNAMPATPPPHAEHSSGSNPAGSNTRQTDYNSSNVASTSYEGKPALYVVHELLAAGYLVGERVVNRASEFDSKYRVSGRTQEQARSLDNHYKFSNYLQQWDEKFNLSKRAKDAYSKVQSHPVGQKVLITVNDAYQSALQLSNDARQIAERKVANDEKLFGKIPIPAALKSSASASQGASTSTNTSSASNAAGFSPASSSSATPAGPAARDVNNEKSG